MTGPAPVHDGPPFPTSDDDSGGTGGPAGVQTCSRCGNIRRETALVPAAEGWQCREPCRKPGGRPAIGPPVLIRLQPELREAIEARARPGESLASTARRLLAEAVTAPREPASAPAVAVACPHCGGAPGELSLGNVMMCGQCGRTFDVTTTPQARAAATQAAMRRAAEGTPAIDGPRVVLAETWQGQPIAIGPVYTDKGADEIRTTIKRHGTTWTAAGPVPIISKAQLPWKLSTWGS